MIAFTGKLTRSIMVTRAGGARFEKTSVITRTSAGKPMSYNESTKGWAGGSRTMKQNELRLLFLGMMSVALVTYLVSNKAYSAQSDPSWVNILK